MANHSNGQSERERERERVWLRGKCCRRTCFLIHQAGSCSWQAHLSHKALAPRTLASVSLSVSIPCFVFFFSLLALDFSAYFSVCIYLSRASLSVVWCSEHQRGRRQSHFEDCNIMKYSYIFCWALCLRGFSCVCVCVCVYLWVHGRFSFPAALNCSTFLFTQREGLLLLLYSVDFLSGKTSRGLLHFSTLLKKGHYPGDTSWMWQFFYIPMNWNCLQLLVKLMMPLTENVGCRLFFATIMMYHDARYIRTKIHTNLMRDLLKFISVIDQNKYISVI